MHTLTYAPRMPLNPWRSAMESNVGANFPSWTEHLQGESGWRDGGGVEVFPFSLIFAQSEVWTHLETEWAEAAARGAPAILHPHFSVSGKVEIERESGRENGIMWRWEVEIACYSPFGMERSWDVHRACSHLTAKIQCRWIIFTPSVPLTHLSLLSNCCL